MARTTRLAPVLFALLMSIPWPAISAEKTARLLFLGNSLTYVGNLPAVTMALCDVSGVSCPAEMIVQGGAMLRERVADQTLGKLPQGAKFDYLILQERGGDYIALPSRVEDKRQAQEAARKLVATARDLGMRPLLLGTYQQDARASADLVAAEAALAAQLGVQHVAVSNVLSCAQRSSANRRWFDADGMHPGPDLTLLMGVLLYRELFGAMPAQQALQVQAPLYGPMNSPKATSFASTQSVGSEVSSRITYDAAAVAAVVNIIERCK